MCFLCFSLMCFCTWVILQSPLYLLSRWFNFLHILGIYDSWSVFYHHIVPQSLFNDHEGSFVNVTPHDREYCTRCKPFWAVTQPYCCSPDVSLWCVSYVSEPCGVHFWVLTHDFPNNNESHPPLLSCILNMSGFYCSIHWSGHLDMVLRLKLNKSQGSFVLTSFCISL